MNTLPPCRQAPSEIQGILEMGSRTRSRAGTGSGTLVQDQDLVQGLDLAQDLVQGLVQGLEVAPGTGLRTKNQTFFDENHGIWSEMRPYGSKWAHIKTGENHMAEGHF